MASFGRLTTAILGVSQENTIALASLNFDFAMIKYEAPPEYKGLGENLSRHRRDTAEDGALHKIARKLGALFESDIPDVPHLIRAYGKRASEIVKTPGINTKDSTSYGAFADHVGADGTTIWASATSGKGVITVHLLACMLARIWTRQEAISIWSELVEQRKEMLRQKTLGDSFLISEAVASRIDLHRSQLATWDASARAWLRTADDAKRTQQTQLRLILDNISLPVSRSSNVHTAVIEAWKKSLRALNDLITGKGLRIQSGDVLLGLSSWHIYPDISVQHPQSHFIIQSDKLISPGGIITVGLVNRGEQTEDGIYWSLPLAHMKHYGDPVTVTRQSGISESDVSYDQFLFVVLGSVLRTWKVEDQDLELPLDLIVRLDDARLAHHSHKSNVRPPQDIAWLPVLAKPARAFSLASGTAKEELRRLISFGQRRCADYLAEKKLHPAPFFGFCDLRLLMDTFPSVKSRDFKNDKRVQFLRQWAMNTCRDAFLKDAVIEFSVNESAELGYTYVLPGNRIREHNKLVSIEDSVVWMGNQIPGDDARSAALLRQDTFADLPADPGVRLRSDYSRFVFFRGQPGKAAIYLPQERHKGSKRSEPWYSEISINHLYTMLTTCKYITEAQIVDYLFGTYHREMGGKEYPKYWEMGGEEYPEYFESLELLISLDCIYSNLPGARVNLRTTSQPLRNAGWTISSPIQETDMHLRLRNVFSCIIYFESGYLDLRPDTLADAFAVSCDNSLFVASQLLIDPGSTLPEIPVKRIHGNIGKSGISILVPPTNPRISQTETENWNVINHAKFDGKLQDCFNSTSLHISLTGYELDINQPGFHGNQDHDAKIVEAAISLHDQGKWVADLDIIKAGKVWKVITLRSSCKHTREERSAVAGIKPLASIDSWMEFLDPPLVSCIVRANSNYMARLAAASLAFQKAYDFCIASSETCWACVAAELSGENPTGLLPAPRLQISSDDEIDALYDSDNMEDSDVVERSDGEEQGSEVGFDDNQHDSEEPEMDREWNSAPKKQRKLVFIS